MTIPKTTKPEYSKLSCCICQQPIDPTKWYNTYSPTEHAHEDCWQLNRSVGHSMRLTTSKFNFLDEEQEHLFIGGVPNY